MISPAFAYGVFANEGVRVPPHAIDMVTDQQGTVIFGARPTGTQVITKQATYMIDSVLSDNTAQSYEFDPCSPLELYSNSQPQVVVLLSLSFLSMMLNGWSSDLG